MGFLLGMSAIIFEDGWVGGLPSDSIEVLLFVVVNEFPLRSVVQRATFG